MAYTFQDSGNGSLVIYIDGVFQDSIAGQEVRYKKNVAQDYVELSDGEHIFYSINVSDVSGANDLDDILDAIEAALPDLATSNSGGGSTPTLQQVTDVANGNETTNNFASKEGDATGNAKTSVTPTGIIGQRKDAILPFATVSDSGITAGTGTINTFSLDSATGVINGVKVFRALLTQSGSSDPVPTILENSLGEVPSFSHNDTGKYIMTTVGTVFTAGKTFMLLNQPGMQDAADPIFYARILRFDNQTLKIVTFDIDTTLGVGDPTDNILNNTELQILVYP